MPDSLREQFPGLDLSCLTEKQLAVVEMRDCGGLSWRKIAAFEGVDVAAAWRRYERAGRILRQRFAG